MRSRSRHSPHGILAACLHVAALLILSFAVGRATSPGRSPFKVYGAADGVPSASIHAMAQDRDGFLWLGTENGLFRFDGGGTARWGAQEGLPSNWVTALAVAPDGSLWVGTNRGLAHLQENRVLPVTLGGKPISGWIMGLAVDGAGVLWGAADTGPFTQTGPQECALVQGLPARHTQALCLGLRTGSVWFAQGSVLRERRRDGQVQTWGQAQGLGKEFIGAVVEDGEGRLWVAAFQHLSVLECGDKRLQDRSAWMQGSVYPAPFPFCDAQGTAWMPSTQGILRLDRDGPVLVDQQEGLPLAWVKGGLVDREGSLWLAGSSLVRRQGGGQIRVFQAAEGLPSNVVWCVSRTPSGALLAGTDEGLVRLGAQRFEMVRGTEGLVVFSVAEDGKDVWIAALEKGLWKVSPSKGTRQRVELPGGVRTCCLVMKDRAGQIWAAPSSKGLKCLRPRQENLDLRPSDFGLSEITLVTLEEAADGTLWAATPQGLFGLRNGKWQRFGRSHGLAAEALQGAHPAPDGTLWVWYDEPHGATHLRIENGSPALLNHVTQESGLPTDLIYGVRDDGRGHLWMTSDQGVILLQRGTIRRLGLGQGLPGEDCAANSLSLDQDGSFWAGMANGITRVDGAITAESIPVPPVKILQISWGGTTHRTPVSLPGTVPHAQGTFEFHFASPSYVDEKALRYQVRLEGIESEWRDCEVRLARYPALPGGPYRFEVRAAYPGGAFGQPAQVAFQVRSPFWRTWWALIATGLVCGLLAYQFSRIRLHRLARTKMRLEGIVVERTEALRNSNDALNHLNEQNLQLIEELSTTLGEVKMLQGLIPICSYCKNIRNDEGYWDKLEQYFQRHSKATFSHGICPECEKKIRAEWISQGALPPGSDSKKDPDGHQA